VPTPPDDDLTIGPVSLGAARTPSASSRFVPGAIVGGRYRLVALLGKGGMGEVYRADDLTLDQPVALKFLPEGVAHDGARLAQFHNELRIARQVSHKNVCRLYDLGDVNGLQFITMEYVDGEDLASLLRRIGRLPHDKAIEIARQLCAGVAAAHERGVLHRDLKPANVMLDGDGNVRITDFGLAIADSSSGDAEHAGTPQYMAPEQFKGQPASVRSDIYALGLILFEIFTGKRAYDAKTLQDLQNLHESGTLTTPSSVVRDMDPAVERVILRCLEYDPAKRPASAIGVAAALPGGDPLAAALAAGETPSPEMVAAAGVTRALSPMIGVALMLFVLAGLLVIAGVGDKQLLVARLPLDKSIDALADRARDVAADLGYTAKPADTAHGLQSRSDYMAYLEKTMPEATRWSSLATADGPTIQFWYRSSPRMMVPISDSGIPSLQDPPVIITGMISIFLDPRGRLNEFLAVPPQTDASTDPPPPTDWSRAFADAGLAMNQFTPATPQWLPRLYADQRAAWTGPLPDPPQTTVRVEMAAYRGRVTYFSIIGPWTQPTRMVEEPRTAQARVMAAVTSSLGLSLLVMIAVLARHNLKVGRGDRRGAARFAAFVLGIWFIVWLIGGRHMLDVNIDTNDFFSHVSKALFDTGLLWLVYMALEPYVRKHSPEILMSWTRLLAGERRDPRVGRDVLIGVAVGISVVLIGIAYRFAMPLLHGPTPWPKGVALAYLTGPRQAVSTLLRMVPNALQNAMIMTFLFAFVRAIAKNTWIAAAAAIAVFGVFVLNEFNESLLFGIPFVVLWTGLLVVTLVEFGMLPLTVAFFVNQVLNNAPFTLDMSKQYAATGLWTMALVAGLAAFGYYASRGAEPLLGDILQTE